MLNGSDRLAGALEAFRDADTADTRLGVLEALAKSELMFPVAERGPGDQSIRLAFTNDEQGRPFLLGFTDEEHFSVWLPGGGPVATAAAAGFIPAMLAGPFAGLLLNPRSEASALVDRQAVELLARGKLPPAESVASSLVKRWV